MIALQERGAYVHLAPEVVAEYGIGSKRSCEIDLPVVTLDRRNAVGQSLRVQDAVRLPGKPAGEQVAIGAALVTQRRWTRQEAE